MLGYHIDGFIDKSRNLNEDDIRNMQPKLEMSLHYHHPGYLDCRSECNVFGNVGIC